MFNRKYIIFVFMIKDLNDIQIIQLIGERLRQYRINLDLTQAELSKASGVSVVTLRNLETGRSTNLTLCNLLALLRYTGLIENIDYLIPEQPISPYARRKILRVRHV